MKNYEELMLEKENEFEKLSAFAEEKTTAFNAEMAQIQDELLRIQGEYRMLTKLKAENDLETEAEVVAEDFEAVEEK